MTNSTDLRETSTRLNHAVVEAGRAIREFVQAWRAAAVRDHQRRIEAGQR